MDCFFLENQNRIFIDVPIQFLGFSCQFSLKPIHGQKESEHWGVQPEFLSSWIWSSGFKVKRDMRTSSLIKLNFNRFQGWGDLEVYLDQRLEWIWWCWYLYTIWLFDLNTIFYKSPYYSPLYLARHITRKYMEIPSVFPMILGIFKPRWVDDEFWDA